MHCSGEHRGRRSCSGLGSSDDAGDPEPEDDFGLSKLREAEHEKAFKWAELLQQGFNSESKLSWSTAAQVCTALLTCSIPCKVTCKIPQQYFGCPFLVQISPCLIQESAKTRRRFSRMGQKLDIPENFDAHEDA